MLLSLVSIILCDIELLPSWLLSENPMLESSFTDINDIEEWADDNGFEFSLLSLWTFSDGATFELELDAFALKL